MFGATYIWRLILVAACWAAAIASAQVAAQERSAPVRPRIGRSSDESNVRPANFEARVPVADEARGDDPSKALPQTSHSSTGVTLSPRRTEPALPLARPGSKSANRAPGGISAFATTLASLMLVLALFMGAAWVLRRGLPKGASALPSEVVEVLGRSPLPGKQQMHLIRCGNKLLLVWSTVHGVQTLTEITDPVEVDRLSSACREAQPGSASSAFRQVFQQLSKEPVQGFLEPGVTRPVAAGRGMSASHREDDHA
ncbi:MAG: FliO/MopB family protein [Pirellulales bacterium]